VKEVLYVIGGQTSCPNQNVINTVWAYYPKTDKWIQKSSMPTPRWEAGIAVENNIIYVIGGFTPDQDLSVVESYNPATDTWKEEMSLPNQAQLPAVGLIRRTIVVAGGYLNGNNVTGDTESYNATENMWTALNADPTARGLVCAGAIGSKLYDAGGSESPTNNALTLAESFTLSTQTWKTLAQMPHGVEAAGAAVYDGRLYCFGGGNDPVSDNFTHYVQIYQP
jgi:N-acetylneuraminic acid mutarotase